MQGIVHLLTANVEKIGAKVCDIFSTVGGWILGIVLAFFAFIGDDQAPFIAVGVAVLLDMFWGVLSAIKRKKFILSFLARETLYKVLIYGTVLSVVLNIERSINEAWGLATTILCVIAAACEVWSAGAHILIIKPDCAFIRLFRKYLIGEIANKLKMSNEEAEEVLVKTENENHKRK